MPWEVSDFDCFFNFCFKTFFESIFLWSMQIKNSIFWSKLHIRIISLPKMRKVKYEFSGSHSFCQFCSILMKKVYRCHIIPWSKLHVSFIETRCCVNFSFLFFFDHANNFGGLNNDFWSSVIYRAHTGYLTTEWGILYSLVCKWHAYHLIPL